MVGMINFLRLMQLLSRALRTAWLFMAWTARVCLAALEFLLTALFIFWQGVPQKARVIANDWLDHAYAAGVPTTHFPALYNIFCCAAFAMIVLGWVVLSYMTVFILRLVF